MARLVQRDGGDDLRRSSLGDGPTLADHCNRQSQRDQENERKDRTTLMYVKAFQVGL